MRLHAVLGLHHGLQVHLRDGFGESNDSLQLPDSDRDAVGLLRDLLLLARRPVRDIHVLKHVACLFTQTREHLHLCVGQVLLQQGHADVSLGLAANLVHVKVDNVSGNFLVQ